MANIFDYLDWRDIELEKLEFNEIDALILCRLAYFPFDGLIKDDEEITVRESYERYKKLGTTGRILQKEDIDLFPKLANSIRFGNIKLSKYINKLDPEQEKQFSAITVILPDDTIFVGYRGTDNTLIGWKEDFNMSFNECVPSQIDAVAYLNNVAKKYKNNILIGGHSKGGNLAVYAATYCRKEVKDRIVQVYNNDGPGFHDSVINSKDYQHILDRIHTYIPQTSIIGRLLEHKEKCTILKSTQTGIMQHDLYTWQILGGHFVEDTLTNSSEFIDKTITNWLKTVDAEQRGKFFDTLFEIMYSTNAETLTDIENNWFSSAKSILKTYQNMDEENKEIMGKTLNTFFKIAKSNVKIGNVIKK